MARLVRPEDMEALARGAALLGSGGGGNPYVGMLWAREELKRHGPVTIVDVDDLKETDFAVTTFLMGSPIAMIEKIAEGDEPVRAVRELEQVLGRKITHILPWEAGGINSTVPFSVAARLGLPLIDADGMGRAFPELQMCTFALHEGPRSPFVVCDEQENTLILKTATYLAIEKLSRPVCVEMGSVAAVAGYGMTARQIKEFSVRNTMSLCLQIGHVIEQARKEKTNVIDAVLGVTGGTRLFQGKVTDVQRASSGGFTRGQVELQGVGACAGRTCKLDFQNEFLLAKVDGQVLGSTPDLVPLLDAETGEPVTTEEVRYGFRVELLGIPCNPLLRTPDGLELVGPRYFGYDFDYVPVEQLAQRAAL